MPESMQKVPVMNYMMAILIAVTLWVGKTVTSNSEQLGVVEAQLALYTARLERIDGKVQLATQSRYTAADASRDRVFAERERDRLIKRMEKIDVKIEFLEKEVMKNGT